MSKPQSKCPYQPIKNDRKDPDISDDIEKNNKGKAKANPWQNDLQGMAKKGGQQGKGGQKKSYGIMHTILFMIPILFKGNCQTKFQLLLTILLTLCAKVLAVTHPIVLKYIIDSLILGESSYYLIAIYIAVRIFSEICNQLREVAFAAISASAEVCITSKVYNHIQNQSLSFHLSRETGRIITICSRGSQSFANVLKFCFFNIGPLILEIGLVVFSVGFMLPVYFWILILFSMVLYILDTYVLTEWRAKYFRDMNNKSNAYNQKATDSLLNFETVKYFNAENHEQRRYNRALTEYASQNVITNNSMVVLNLSQNFCVFIGLICNLMLGAYMIDTRTINAGDFVMLNTYFFQIYSPLFFLGTYWRVIRQAMVDVEQVFEILDSDQSIKDPINPESLLKGQGEIEFKNVSFAYESNPNKLIIDNLSFKIEAGKSVAIVGATGSGKSTIVRLLYRFYDVTGGKIFVDGQDISKLRISDHRSKISVVPQDTVLFNETIKYNLAYGGFGDNTFKEMYNDPLRQDELLTNLKKTANKAQILNYIESKQKQFEEIVGERGLKLSGGERQRVSIARALLKHSPIMIFDEATSSLDTATEREIQDAINTVANNVTALMIAHRLSTIKDCDNIIVLKLGRIVESGTHQELLSKKGEYWKLWNKQTEEQLLLSKEQEEKLHEEQEREKFFQEQSALRKKRSSVNFLNKKSS